MQGYVSIDMSVKGEGGHSSMPPVTRLTVRPVLLRTSSALTVTDSLPGPVDGLWDVMCS